MSTRLITSPKKDHELCDDLESLWFVLLFEGLHYLKHNRPGGIGVAEIFDYGFVCPETGTYHGGLWKRCLYHSVDIPKKLKFDSEPFTALVRQIYQLFKSLDAHYVAQDEEVTPTDAVEKNVEKLESCAEIEKLLRVALESKEWPTNCDKVEDQYPPGGRLTPQQMDVIALSYVNRPLVPSGASSGGKRKREEEDDPLVFNEVKRPKVAPPLWKRIWLTCTLLVGV